MSSQHRHLQQHQLQQQQQQQQQLQQQQQQQQFLQQHHQQQMTEKLNVQEIAAKFNQAINLNQNTVPRSQARLPSYALGQNFGSNVSLMTGSNVSLGPQDNRLMQNNVLMSSQASQVTNCTLTIQYPVTGNVSLPGKIIRLSDRYESDHDLIT